MELDPARASDALRKGELDLLGRMAWSSNATFLVNASLDDAEVPGVYKPQRGERPLWDFPEGSLCKREVAAYELSEALGWAIVPETVLRDGPYGLGMVQRFVDHDPEEHYFTLLEAHPDDFKRFAVFDVLANNADRKGGHCLAGLADGHVWGIDHGLTFHVADKLRTVIWDFAGEPVPPPILATVECVLEDLDGPFGHRLGELLAPSEVAAVGDRARTLLRRGRYPVPDEGYHSVPWPLV
ncbi:MAG TPA: SCO1664 family protein [Acidimicrobiia bacterium]